MQLRKYGAMKARKLLLAAVLGIVILAPSASATAQGPPVTFEQADGPDDACEWQNNSGVPFELSIDGGEPLIQEDGSVVPVPQGSSVRYLPVERTFGSTAVGVIANCQVVVASESTPEPEPTPASGDTSSDGIGVPVIVGAGVVVLVLAGVVWKLR